jgi:hypothetical protein
MALVGGGGAGNVGGGANPSSTSSGLNYVGNHCYAYSGSIDITSQVQTMLNFTTGSEYNVVKIQTGVKNSSGAQSDDIEIVIQLNGEVVMARMLSHNNESGLLEAIDLLIAPFTTVLITCDNIQGTTSTPTQVTITGRTY